MIVIGAVHDLASMTATPAGPTARRSMLPPFGDTLSYSGYQPFSSTARTPLRGPPPLLHLRRNLRRGGKPTLTYVATPRPLPKVAEPAFGAELPAAMTLGLSTVGRVLFNFTPPQRGATPDHESKRGQGEC